MARRPRGDRPGSWHHVVNRAIAKRPYFETRADQRYFLAQLAIQVRSGRLEVHAFCLMTTHFHLLVRSPSGELSEAMRRVQYRYSRKFNRLRKRDGPLIRARFFSKRADTDLYRRAIVRYIDVNPVKAGLVATSAEYEFGSARMYLAKKSPRWLTTDWIKGRALELTGETRFSMSSYLKTFGPRDSEDIDSLCSFIEMRMGAATERDPLADLVGTTSSQVQAWMRRKALLADGHEVGLPVCGAPGLARAIERNLESEGEWLVDQRRRTWRGSELARIALLRTLCSSTWQEVAVLTGRTVDEARGRFKVHAEAMSKDCQHSARTKRIAAGAIASAVAIDG